MTLKCGECTFLKESGSGKGGRCLQNHLEGSAELSYDADCRLGYPDIWAARGAVRLMFPDGMPQENAGWRWDASYGYIIRTIFPSPAAPERSTPRALVLPSPPSPAKFLAHRFLIDRSGCLILDDPQLVQELPDPQSWEKVQYVRISPVILSPGTYLISEHLQTVNRIVNWGDSERKEPNFGGEIEGNKP